MNRNYATSALERMKVASSALFAIEQRANGALAHNGCVLDAEYVLIAIGQVRSNIDDWLATVGDDIEREAAS